MLDVIASAPQYAAHTRPIYDLLPASVKGRFMHRDEFVPGGSTYLVDSYNDLMFLRDAAPGVPVIFMEHGAGLIFGDRHGTFGSYAGSRERPNVEMFLCPNEYVARANARAHPTKRVEVIGCPKLDVYHALPPKPRDDPPTIAFGFHFDCIVSPGTRSALPYYKRALADLRDYHVLAHGHPRMEIQAKMIAMELGYEWAEYDRVMREADLFISDVSSMTWEFASLDRPVVVCNIPEYQDMPDTGIRFWKEIPGIQCWGPENLLARVHTALEDGRLLREQRHAAVDAVYPIRGNATATALAHIVDFMT